MTSFRVGAATRADQELYTRARMVEVSCETCSVVVGVKKNSDQHTSIQWSRGGVSACPEFAELSARAGGRAVYTPCPRLTASIETAVAAGRIEIGATDGY